MAFHHPREGILCEEQLTNDLTIQPLPRQDEVRPTDTGIIYLKCFRVAKAFGALLRWLAVLVHLLASTVYWAVASSLGQAMSQGITPFSISSPM